MTIYTCSKTSYITFNAINLNIYITNLSIDCVVDLLIVFIDFHINVFINFVNDCCVIFIDCISNVLVNYSVISSNLSINILIYFIKDCSVVSFNLVINSRFDVSNSSANFTVQCFDCFCIFVDSSFVIANELTVFDSNCTSYIDVFFVLIYTFSKTIQVTFKAINFNTYIVDCVINSFVVFSNLNIYRFINFVDNCCVVFIDRICNVLVNYSVVSFNLSIDIFINSYIIFCNLVINSSFDIFNCITNLTF